MTQPTLGLVIIMCVVATISLGAAALGEFQMRSRRRSDPEFAGVRMTVNRIQDQGPNLRVQLTNESIQEVFQVEIAYHDAEILRLKEHDVMYVPAGRVSESLGAPVNANLEQSAKAFGDRAWNWVIIQSDPTTSFWHVRSVLSSASWSEAEEKVAAIHDRDVWPAMLFKEGDGVDFSPRTAKHRNRN